MVGRSIKQMGWNCLARFIIGVSIVCIAASMASFIIYSFAKCSQHDCSSYQQAKYQCEINGNTYCCKTTTETCGDPFNCWQNATNRCYGFLVAGIASLSVGVFLLLLTFVFLLFSRMKDSRGAADNHLIPS
jgi:hypothetical protein